MWGGGGGGPHILDPSFGSEVVLRWSLPPNCFKGKMLSWRDAVRTGIIRTVRIVRTARIIRIAGIERIAVMVVLVILPELALLVPGNFMER